MYAVRNLEVKQESLRIAKDLNRITKIKIDVGSLAPIDIVQTEVGIAQAEQDIIIAEGLIGDGQDQLKRALNFDPARWSTPIVPTDKIQAEKSRRHQYRGGDSRRLWTSGRRCSRRSTP